MAGDNTALATAVLAYLDTDVVWGASHERTLAARRRLQVAATATLREHNAVDIDRPVLRVLQGARSAAG